MTNSHHVAAENRFGLPLPPEHGDVLIHGFAGGNELAGKRIALGGDQFCAQALQGIESKLVLFVEVAGDDQQAVVGDLFQALLEDLLPQLRAVPEVLVTEQHHIEILAQFLVGFELSGVFEKELGGQVTVAFAGLKDFTDADVSTDESDLLGLGLRFGEVH